MLRANLKKHRLGLASTGVVLVVVFSIAAYAMATPGFKVHHSRLNDGGVWVTESARFGVIGRLNKPVGKLEASVGLGQDDGRQRGQDLDVVQNGAAVFGWNQATGELKPINGATSSTSGKAAAVAPGVPGDPGRPLPVGSTAAQVMAGGQDTAVLAVLDTKSGELRAMHIDPDQPATSVDAIDKKSPVVADVKSPASMAVSQTGVIFIATATGTLVTIEPNADGFDQPITTHLPSLAATPAVTAVGATPVLFDGTQIVVPGRKPVPIQDGKDAALQHPGPAAAGVVLATPTGLTTIDLAKGTVVATPSRLAGGSPVAPVRTANCVRAAWQGGTARYLTACDGQPQPYEGGVDAEPNATLVFRVNRSQVVLTDPRDGRVWDVDGKTAQRDDQWDSLFPATDGGNGSSDPTPGDSGNQVTARPDPMKARVGRTSILPVLDNDTYPRNDIIAITGNLGQLSNPAAKAVISGDEQTIALTVPADATAPITFDYTITGSQPGSKPSTARVSVDPVQPGDPNDPPACARCDKQSWVVGAGAVLDMPVLADWRDRQNDALSLLSAEIDGRSNGQAPPQVTADGDILFTAPPKPQTVVVSYKVSDGFGGITEQKARVKVLSATDIKAGAAPTPKVDVAQTTVGQPVTIYPLSNDLPGADPTSDSPTLQLSTVSQRAGTTVDVDTQHGAVTFTASKSGTYLLNYSESYGAQSSGAGRIRVDVTVPGRSDAAPIALPDRAVLFGASPTVVDVLANDYDRSGAVLVVQHAEATADSGLRVSVISGHWLQISLPNQAPAARPASVSYTVTDGLSEATSTVTVIEQAANVVSPVALPDVADVREGDSVSIPVTDNDIDPAGGLLALAQGSVSDLTGGGSAFTTGNTIRYVAPRKGAGVATFSYVVSNGQDTATGTVSVRIHALGADPAATDLPPRPPVITQRVVAGGSAVIPIPTSGVDPDGDSVTLLGLRDPGPKFGVITSTTASSLTYAAFPIDSLGTDTIGYRITDRYGRTGDGTIRIAVVLPGNLQPPTPVDDRFEAEPGADLAIDVVGNDIVSPGDTVKVVLAAGDSGATVDSKNPHIVHVTAPAATDQPVQILYSLLGGVGQSDGTAKLTVTGHVGFDNAPIARDDNAKPASRTAATVDVPVLQNDVDPDSTDLKVSVPLTDTATVLPDQRLRIKLTSQPQVVPYTVSDGQKTSGAFVYVPALDTGSAYLSVSDAIKVPLDGSTKTLDVNKYVVAPNGKRLSLGFSQNFFPAPSSGLQFRKTGTSTFVLTGVGHYAGPAAVTVQVTDGATVADKGASNDFVTIPVQVGDLTPVLRCPDGFTQVVYQGGRPAPVDLASACYLWTPNGLNRDAVQFRTSWAKQPTGVSQNLSGSVVTFKPSRDAQHGQSGALTVGLVGSRQTQTIGVRVDAVPKLRLDAISRTGHNAKPLTIHISDAAHTQVLDPSFKVLSCTQRPSETAKATCSMNSPRGGDVVITPADSARGSVMFDFTITDVPGDASRTIAGSLRLNIIGRPAPPSSVTASANRTSGGSVEVRWTGPAFDGGAPIDHYTVVATPGGRTKQCTGSRCVVDGLTNGQQYYFDITTWNTANESSATTARSNTVIPDKKPGLVSGFAVTTVADGQLTLAWGSTDNGGSALTGYVVQQTNVTEPDPAGPKTFNPTASPLTVAVNNNDLYQFRIAAVNGDGIGPFSTPDVPGQAAGVPDPVAAPSVPAEDLSTPSPDTFVHISWEQDPNPHGGPIDSYNVYRRAKSNPANVLAVPTCQKIDPTVRSCDDRVTNDGTVYEYSVTALNSTTPSGYGKESVATNWSPFTATGRPEMVMDLKAYASQAGYNSRTADPGATGGTGVGFDGKLKVTFTVPAPNDAAVGSMEFSLNNGASWQTLTSCGSAWAARTEGCGVISNLTNGNSYSIQVREVNQGGVAGTASATAPAEYPYGPPQTPTVNAYVSSGTTVQYTASVGSNGRTPDLHVRVDGGAWTDTGSTSWSTSANRGYSATYSLDAYATDTAGQQSSTASTSGRTPDVPAPSSGNCNGTNGLTLVYNWNNVGSGITYEFQWNGSGWQNNGSSTQSTQTGGAYSTSYPITVRATDGAGHYSSNYGFSCQTGPDPTPSINAWDGGKSGVQPGTCSGSCHALAFQFSNNFATGDFTWQCLEKSAQGVVTTYYTSTAKIHAAPGAKYADSSTIVYCANTNANTAIKVNNVTSNFAYLGSG